MINNAYNLSILQRAYDNLAPEDDDRDVILAKCRGCDGRFYEHELVNGLCEECGQKGKR